VGISLKELGESDVEVFKSVLAENVLGRIVEEHRTSTVQNTIISALAPKCTLRAGNAIG